MKPHFLSQQLCLLAFLFLIHGHTWTQISHLELRKTFPSIVESESRCKALANELEDSDPNNYHLLAYKGAINIVLASYAKVPRDKMNYFKAGKNDLELAMKNMPDNLELHFLRFTVQQKVPPVLKYNTEEEDLPFIAMHYSSIEDPAYKKHVAEMMINSGKCSKEQILAFEKP